MVAGVSEVGVGPSGDGVAGVPGVGVGPMWCDRVAGTGKLLYRSVDSPSISWLWVSEGFAAMLWWMVGGCLALMRRRFSEELGEAKSGGVRFLFLSRLVGEANTL